MLGLFFKTGSWTRERSSTSTTRAVSLEYPRACLRLELARYDIVDVTYAMPCQSYGQLTACEVLIMD